MHLSMPRKIVLAGLPLLAAMSLACSQATPTGTTGTGETPAGNGQPKVNRLVFITELPTLESNEKRMLATPYMWQLMPMYESLIGVDASNGKRIPELATGWKIEPDGKSWRFQLRKGIQFQKGYGEFTSKDLPKQIEQARRPGSHAGIAGFWTTVAESIEPTGDYEVVYHLKQPDSTFLDYIGDQVGGAEVYSDKHFKEIGDPTYQSGPVVGTGPYEYVERAQSQYIRFKRVENHWRAKPDFPEFEWRFVNEASTRMAALLAGEAHMSSLPTDLTAQAQKQNFKVVTGKVPALRVFMNFYCCILKDQNNPSGGYMDPSSPLTDVRVRAAVSKAINRDELNKGFFGGKGEVTYLNPFHPVREGWSEEWVKNFPQEYGFDPEGARKLLAEAGYGPSKPAKIQFLLTTTPGVSSISDVMEAMASYWRNVGIQPELVSMDAPTVRTMYQAFKLTNHATIIGTNSTQWIGSTVFGSYLSRANGGPELPEADAILKQIGATVDDAKRAQLWTEYGNIIYKEHRYVPLFWLPVEAVVDPKVVADWTFPGSISGNWTHIEAIKAVK